jgi:hypothetical protein
MKTLGNIILIVAFTSILSCTKDRTSQTSQIPNGDFEEWNSYPLLFNWTTNSCPLCDPPFESYIVQKDSSAYHGKYAAKFIYNNVFPASAENKFPLTYHPLALGGYFKCIMNGLDTTYVKIWLFKNKVAVDSGAWLNMASLPEYQYMRIPISQGSKEVDTVVIRITGGHRQGNLPATTVLWADYLNLE